MKKNYPKISIIIPTLNSASILKSCLISIREQIYPQNKLEIIISDGGSTDTTLNIAKSYKCKIFSNPLKTAEAGKAVGVSKATGKYIALIDSDNILPTKRWLQKMIQPLEDHSDIIGSEPWSYTYRPQGGFIERYSALTGVNDPYALIANNYERKNYLRPTWNGLNIKIKDHKSYQTFFLKKNNKLPTIGANGTIYRSKNIKSFFSSPYLVDIDLLTHILKTTDNIMFAKVKCGIIHTYCESSITKFIRKQNRRATDIYIYQNVRPPSLLRSHLTGNIFFVLYVILIIPMLFDTLKGLIKKPDPAWLFHPLACIITLWSYGYITIKYRLGILKPVDRGHWSQ